MTATCIKKTRFGVARDKGGKQICSRRYLRLPALNESPANPFHYNSNPFSNVTRFNSFFPHKVASLKKQIIATLEELNFCKDTELSVLRNKSIVFLSHLLEIYKAKRSLWRNHLCHMSYNIIESCFAYNFVNNILKIM